MSGIAAGRSGATGNEASLLRCGGGIGLVAAYRLRAAVGADATITVFDPADRLGASCAPRRWPARRWTSAPRHRGAPPEVPALLAELGLGGLQIGTTGVRLTVYAGAAFIRCRPTPSTASPARRGR